MIETNPAPLTAAEELASRIANDSSALDGALAAMGPERIPQPVREGAIAALKLVARDRPSVLLDRWGELTAYLSASNAYTQMSAVHLVAILGPAAGADAVAAVLPRFAALLGGQVSVAGHTLMALGEIAAALPQLRPQIAGTILGLEAVAIPDRLGLLRSYAIEALDAFIAPNERTPSVVEFVSRGLEDGAKTRKIARDVLTRWAANESVFER